MPVISTTGDFGVNPACLAAALRLCPTAADAASPTAPQRSQIYTAAPTSAKTREDVPTGSKASLVARSDTLGEKLKRRG